MLVQPRGSRSEMRSPGGLSRQPRRFQIHGKAPDGEPSASQYLSLSVLSSLCAQLKTQGTR